MIEFYRPRGASPSLGLGLGGAPRKEKARSRRVLIPGCASEGFLPSRRRLGRTALAYDRRPKMFFDQSSVDFKTLLHFKASKKATSFEHHRRVPNTSHVDVSSNPAQRPRCVPERP